MSDNMMLLAVFLSQIFVLSYGIPRVIVGRIKRVFNAHSPEDYPKLYPVPLATIERHIAVYQLTNAIAMVLGLVIVGLWAYSGSDQMLNWDSQSVLNFYFMLQALPMLFLEVSGRKYLKLMRRVNKSTTRVATLQPRRLFNYVSPLFLSGAVVTYIAFIVVVYIINQNPFDGFAGYVNVAGVTGLNLFFAAIAAKQIYAKNADPHQDSADRDRQISLITNIMVFSSIAATVSITVHFVLASMDLRHLNDVAQCIYFQLIMLVLVYNNSFEQSNYEVYKQDVASAQ